MHTPQFDIVIVGGGAAGLATAIFSARARPVLRIALLDGARKLGAKILVSGGGRCNVTNVRVTAEDFWGGSRNTIRRILRAFDEKQTVDFFAQLGVSLHEEEWGKLFPDSNRAETVLEALITEAKKRGVDIRTGHRVTGITRSAGNFRVEVHAQHPSPIHFESPMVVLATGGKSLPKTGSDGWGYELARTLGHSIVPPTPGLAPLVLRGEFHKLLSGVAQETTLTITVAGEKPLRITGPMLWTHFGISGPAALDLSRHWHRAALEGKSVRVTANFVPGYDFHAVEQRLLSLIHDQPRQIIKSTVSSLVPTSLAEALLRHCAISPQMEASRLTRGQRRALIHALIELPLDIEGSRGYNFAEVTAGGVPLAEIDPSTMESRKCPGLFLVGEILDVDGRIGGFNFQWAWSSAHMAAEGIARRLDAVNS